MDWRGDIAVGDSAAEVIGEAPLAGQAFLDASEVMLVNVRDVMVYETHCELASLEHGLDEGVC